MQLRLAIVVLILAAFFSTGCSLPRGPINFDPLIPRWVSHRDVSCECPPEALPQHAGVGVDPSAVQPPHPKFHPVPTQPVFEPLPAHWPMSDGL